MIIYVHGFGGSGQGSKASALRILLKDQNFIAPSLSTIPDLAIATLCELIETFQKYEKVYLIGSSLGGYYALFLAQKYSIPAVLINPAIHPYVTLEPSLGEAPSFYDLSSYEWRDTHLQMLKNFETHNPDITNYLLLLQKGDELLDYREALKKLPGSRQIVEEGGDHSFVGIEKYAEIIISFFKD